MYIDFASAFNTTDHDKLLWIMLDLGFPAQAVRAVRSLYSDATTTIRSGLGDTKPIPIERGTIQGDSLSPFLFPLFIEPLLRWLECGERGYQFACDNNIKQLAANAFADDLAILTPNVQNLQIQAACPRHK